MLLAEFDVPVAGDGGPAHLAYLAERYERGLAEYEGSAVAQGFLMPVLVGQVVRVARATRGSSRPRPGRRSSPVPAGAEWRWSRWPTTGGRRRL